MHRFQWVITVVVLLMLSTAWAEENQAVEKITLEQAIQKALEDNQEISEAQGGLLLAKGQVLEAKTGYWPKMKISVGYGYGKPPKMGISDELMEIITKTAGFTTASEMLNKVDQLAVLALVAGPDGQMNTPDDLTIEQAIQMLSSTDPAENPLRHYTDPNTPITINNDELRLHFTDNHANPINWQGNEYYFDFSGTRVYPLADYSWDQVYRSSYALVQDSSTLPSMSENFLVCQMSLVQPIYTFGKISGYHRASDMQYKVAKQELTKVANRVVYQVKRRYYQVLLATDCVNLAQEAVGRLKATRALTAALLKNRTDKVTTLDLLKNDIFLHKAKEKLIQAQSGLKLAACALNFEIGLPPKEEILLAEETLQGEPVEYQLPVLVEKMFAKRPEWFQLQAGIQAREAQVQIAHSDYFPMLGVTGDIQYLRDHPEVYAGANPDPTWRVAIGLAYEHFDFFQTTNAKVKQAEGELAKLRAKEKWAKQGLILEVKKAFFTSEEHWQRARENQAAAEAAGKHYHLCFKGYQIGTKEFSDVIEAQMLESEAKFTCKQSLYNYQLALAELCQVVGVQKQKTLDSR
ncbi:TolC family protein [bacterium]|nr:TolC family protein [bacterium]